MELLTEMRTYLIAQGVSRNPRVAGPLPPLWLEPQFGTPAPGESPSNNPVEIGNTIVMSAFQNSGVPPGPYESFQRQDIVEIWLRVTTAPLAHQTERALRLALIDKRAWQMAGMQIIESELWRPLQLLVSDAQAFTYNLSFWFQRYA